MPNVQISDLPLAVIPLDLTGTFFEVQTIESGVEVSRKVAGDNLSFSGGIVQGTSTDDPAIAAGSFDGQQLFQNANAIQTGSVGFSPAGDDFIIQNFAEGGEVSLRVRDGTIHLVTADYGVDIPTTGAIKVPVGTTAQEPAPVDGQIRYDSDNNVFRGVVSGVWVDLGGGLPTGSIGQTLFNSDGAEGYTATSGLTINPNGTVRMTFDAAGAANIEFEVAANGLILRDTVTASPNNLLLTFLEDSGFPVTLARFGYNASDIFTLDGLATQVDINSNNPSGVLISHIGVPVFQTFVGGYKVLGVTFDVDNDGADTLTRSRVRNLTGGVDLRVVPGGDASITQLVGTTGGTEDNWLLFARNLGVTINHNNLARFATTADGADAFGSVFDVINSANANTDMQVRNSQGGFMARVSVATGNILLAQTTLGGVIEDTWISLTRNGLVGLFFDNTQRAATSAVGLDVLGTLLDIDNTGAATATRLLARNSAGGVDLGVNVAGNVSITQRSSVDAFEDNIITHVRNSLLTLFHNNVATARTATLASGGFEVNNTLSGGGFEQAATITTGSFTGTLTGFAASPTPTIQFIKIDNRVTLYITADAVATSNTTAMTMTGVPAALQPTNDKDHITRGVNNSSNVLLAPLLTGGGGVITFGILNASPVFTNTGFTASGNKGLLAGWSFSYILD